MKIDIKNGVVTVKLMVEEKKTLHKAADILIPLSVVGEMAPGNCQELAKTSGTALVALLHELNGTTPAEVPDDKQITDELAEQTP